MISVTIIKNDWRVGYLNISLEDGVSRYRATFNGIDADGSVDHIKNRDFKYPDGEMGWRYVSPMEITTKAMTVLFPSVMAQEGRKTARETIKDWRPVSDSEMTNLKHRFGMLESTVLKLEGDNRELKQRVAILENLLKTRIEKAIKNLKEEQ